MRVLVTGGSGFIGRHLVKAVSAEHEVLFPSHGELDLTDAEAVRHWLHAHDVDAVVHSAVKPGHRNAADVTKLTEVNLRQFFSLVRCRAAFERFVVLTSGAVYGAQRSIINVPEEALGEVVPTDDHGFSKYIESLWLAQDANAVELRPFGVYGPGEDYAIRFVSNACCKAVLGMPITLRIDRIFSYVWVDDLASLAGRALLGEGDGGLPPGAYNVVPDETASLRAIADLIVTVHGEDIPVVVGEAGLGLEYSGRNDRLHEVLPGLAWTDLRAGVERLYAHYAARRDELDRGPLLVDK